MPFSLSEFWKRPAFRWVLRLALGLLVLWVLLGNRQTFSQLLVAWRGVSLWVFPCAVGFYWLGQLLCVWKWQLLLQSRGHDVPLGVCARVYGAGMFGNLWLPTNVGGDALRAHLLQKNAPEIGLADAAASILVERLTGFAALLALAVGGILLGGAAKNAIQTVLWSALLLMVVGALCWVISRLKIKKIAALKTALAFYGKPENRRVLVVSLALSLVFQGSQVLLNLGLARTIGLNLPDAIFVWLGPVLSLSGLLPVGIGGLGVREAGALGLVGGLAPHGKIIAWSLLWQATVWGASLPGVLFLKGKR